jgi:hypothetical protein
MVIRMDGAQRRVLGLWLAIGLGLPACSNDNGGAERGGDVAYDSTPADAVAPPEQGDTESDTDAADAVQARDSVETEPVPCTRLFGRPAENTGLDATLCAPSCECDALVWEQPDYDAAVFADLRSWENTAPFAPLSADPYGLEDPPQEQPEWVCAVVPEGEATSRYTVQTFDSLDAAWDAGAIPTHFGACGLCSTLENLEVYLRVADLTTPVRACALRGISAGEAATLACLMEIGFDLPCASIWYYNANHTRSACFSECIRALNEPFHAPDGSLNPCIACDEEQSGAVFKAVAGRTRRNSGMATALCRPCEEVRPLVHDYRNPQRAR